MQDLRNNQFHAQAFKHLKILTYHGDIYRLYSHYNMIHELKNEKCFGLTKCAKLITEGRTVHEKRIYCTLWEYLLKQ
jgi:hypothetical protein